MNKNALNDAYQSFTQGGYNGSIDDFKQLIATNPNALNDSYDTFKAGGYNGDINSFVTLMGVEGASTIKKKRFEFNIRINCTISFGRWYVRIGKWRFGASRHTSE